MWHVHRGSGTAWLFPMGPLSSMTCLNRRSHRPSSTLYAQVSMAVHLTTSHPHTLTPSHPHILTSSHPHNLTASHPHNLTTSHTSHIVHHLHCMPRPVWLFTSQPHTLTSSHPHTLTPSQPHTLTSSQPHNLTTSHPHSLTTSQPSRLHNLSHLTHHPLFSCDIHVHLIGHQMVHWEAM